jgi:hypothetical protein
MAANKNSRLAQAEAGFRGRFLAILGMEWEGHGCA